MVSIPDSLLENVIKDIGEIHSRLFDHRPFLGGEIKFFLREFEEKRGDREVERLFKMLEQLTELRETQADKCAVLADQQLCNVSANLEVALRMCTKINEKEAVDREEGLLGPRILRTQRWQEFTEDMADKQSRVDSTFEEKEAQLRQYYAELEDKLHVTN